MRLTYSWKQLDTHKCGVLSKTGHTTVGRDASPRQPGRRCLGMEAYVTRRDPSPSVTWEWKSKRCKSEERLAPVSAMSRASFIESRRRERVELSPRPPIQPKTSETFQVWEYRGCGGRCWKTPRISRTTRGCWPTGAPSKPGKVEDRAERYTFNVR